MTADGLPDIAFCDIDPAAAQADAVSTYEAITGRTLAAGNPERLLLEAVAVVLAQQRYLIDWTGKQNLVAYATGDYLAHLGAFYGCTRLAATAATVTLRFSTDAVRDFAVLIPAGTRVTPNNALIFSTMVTAVIPAGQLTVDVLAVCADPGPVGSGFLAGQITKFIDVLSGVTSVVNTSTSFGGADEEDDARYRTRIRLACEAFSTCGPEGAYLYHALTASPIIVDAAAVAHEPGVVTVYPLCTGGELPPEAIIAAVRNALTGRKVRPLTDIVQVRPPEIVTYDVRARWYLAESTSARAGAIAAAVETARADYLDWQRGRLGRDIDPSEMTARIKAAGVKRVEVESPTYTHIEAWQVAVPGTVEIVFGGMEGA
ncbi:baseplate assembly protein [Solidesulfovibrio sp.]